MQNKKQKSILKGPLLAILIALSITSIFFFASYRPAGMSYSPIWENARLRLPDRFFKLRHWWYENVTKENLRPKDIVLVTIDEQSYKRLEKRWPWGRDVFADFLDRLSKHGPKTIALDFALYGQSPDDSQADAKLASAIEKSGNVIVASVYGKEKLYLGPYDIFAKASAGYGVIGAARDPDNVIRRLKTFALVLAPQKGGDISFEVKAAAHYLGVPYDRISREKRSIILESESKRVEIPTNDDGDLLINYLSYEEDIKTVPIWKVMEGVVPRDIFKDKLVLVSQTGEIFHDWDLTPLGRKPGGMIIANVLNSIISSSYIHDFDRKVRTGIVVILYVLSFILFYKKQPLKAFFEVLLPVLVIYFVISFFSFLKGQRLPTFDIAVLLPVLFLSIAFYKYALIIIDSASVKRMAITDSLTLLYTHRYFRFLIEHKVKQAIAFDHKTSLIVIKIVNIDRIIKEISFNRGQTVQKRIAGLLRAKMPKNTAGAYLGMGEFSMLLPKVGMYEALGIAGSLRDNIKEMDFGVAEEFLKPVVAIGVSEVNPEAFPKTGVELMRTARASMARAKEIGYNKICRFNPKLDSAVFEPDVVEREIRQRLDDEFSFIAIDLEERNKELEDLLRQLSVTQRDLEQAYFETLRSLIVALEEKDPYTAGHSERVGEYAEKIGRKLKMPEEQLKLLRQAGVLHDIGKVGIPQDILRKEDKLNVSERHLIELHPEFSVRILNTSKYFRKIIYGIRDHHERLDGSGYPRGLKGPQICIEAQIISVVDVFDALSTDRPYRKAFTCRESMEEILAHPDKHSQKIGLALKKILEEEGSM